MPREFANGIDGLSIGDQNGSCGAAAFHGQQVIVPDVTKDSRFAKFGDFPLKHGVSALLVYPIFRKRWKGPGLIRHLSLGSLFPHCL